MSEFNPLAENPDVPKSCHLLRKPATHGAIDPQLHVRGVANERFDVVCLLLVYIVLAVHKTAHGVSWIEKSKGERPLIAWICAEFISIDTVISVKTGSPAKTQVRVDSSVSALLKANEVVNHQSAVSPISERSRINSMRNEFGQPMSGLDDKEGKEDGRREKTAIALGQPRRVGEVSYSCGMIDSISVIASRI